MIDKRLKIFRCQNIRALSIQTTFKAFFFVFELFYFRIPKRFFVPKMFVFMVAAYELIFISPWREINP